MLCSPRGELLPQADDQALAVRRAAAHVVNGLVLRRKGRGHRLPRLLEAPAFERRFGLARAPGGKGHPAVGNARAAHNAVSAQIHPECARHDADVQLPALGHFQEVDLPRCRLAPEPGNDDLLDDLCGLQRRLSVANEKLIQRNRSFPACGREHHGSIQGKENRRAVPDGGRCCQVAAHRGPVPDPTRSKHAQHLGQGRVLGAQKLLDGRQRGGPAHVPLGRCARDPGQLRHSLGGDEERVGEELLVDVHPDLSGSGHQPRLGVFLQKGKDLTQRSWPEKPPAASGVVQGRKRFHR